MKLVWTYDSSVERGGKNDTTKTILLNYYLVSITSAKKIGYKTIMYCDEDISRYFENIVDELHIITSYNTKIWDYLKVKVLEERTDEYCLIDGDLILEKQLPKFETDIVVDTFETANWGVEYYPIAKHLENLGIGNYIKEWNSIRKPITSTGLLYIKDTTNKMKYVDSWYKCNEFINNNNINKNIDYISLVGGQYLLSLLSTEYNWSITTFSQTLGKRCEYYKHDAGERKYNSPRVPTTYILDMNKTDII
jgi:hypothetical protein